MQQQPFHIDDILYLALADDIALDLRSNSPFKYDFPTALVEHLFGLIRTPEWQSQWGRLADGKEGAERIVNLDHKEVGKRIAKLYLREKFPQIEAWIKDHSSEFANVKREARGVVYEGLLLDFRDHFGYMHDVGQITRQEFERYSDRVIDELQPMKNVSPKEVVGRYTDSVSEAKNRKAPVIDI